MTSTKVIAAGTLAAAGAGNANLDENAVAVTTQKISVSFVATSGNQGEKELGTVRVYFVTSGETGITTPWINYKNEVRFIESKLNPGPSAKTYAASEAFVPKGANIYTWTENGVLTQAGVIDVYVNEVTA